MSATSELRLGNGGSIVGGAGKRGRSRRQLTKGMRPRPMAEWPRLVEELEPRRLFSVGSWFGPYNDPGAEWTFSSGEQTSQDHPAILNTPYYEVVVGPATFNGISCTEIDEGTDRSYLQTKEYVGLDGDGDYVIYGSVTKLKTGTQTDTYAPYQVSLIAGIGTIPFDFVSFSDTDTTVVTGPDGSTSTTPQIISFFSEYTGGTAGGYTGKLPANPFTYSVTNGPASILNPAVNYTEFVVQGVGLVSSQPQDSGTTYLLYDFNRGPHTLSITTPPSQTTVGDKMAPVKVTVLNPSLTTDPTDSITMTATITPTGSATGSLGGTTEETTKDGVATFNNLIVNKPGEYTMTFTDSDGDTITSEQFQITGGRLKFEEPPIKDTSMAGTVEPAVRVELVDNKGKVITDDPSMVTLGISGTNATNPIMGNVAQMVNGVAEFPSLKLTVPDTYTLSATDDQNDTTTLSNSFKVTPLHLAFEKQPAQVSVGTPLKYVIALKNADDKVVTSDSTDAIRVVLVPLDASTGVLSSAADIFLGGIANNSGTPALSIDNPGTYKLTITEISNNAFVDSTTITSNSFKIIADKLAFIKPPTKVLVNSPLHYEIALLDSNNNPVTSNSDHLQFTLVRIKGGIGATLVTNTDSLVGGTANNSGGVPLSINVPGTYRLIVTDVPANPGDPVAKSITSIDFEVVASIMNG